VLRTKEPAAEVPGETEGNSEKDFELALGIADLGGAKALCISEIGDALAMVDAGGKQKTAPLPCVVVDCPV
jgi:hypothetical protein